MITRVRKYIRDNQMLKAEDMVVAGVSGGADSIAMLHILKSLQKEIGFSMEVVHVHHGIRGQEADRDEQFVEKICRGWGIPFRSRHYPVPELSGKWKLGEEETGRIVRKQAFQEEKKRLGFSGEQSKKNGQFRVALAHNRNDLAETMLHHLARGTGIRGLSGIQAVNGEIIRPVLCLERKEIVNYLKERGISYITDSSNLSDDYTRNRIRNHILPAMEQKINAKAVEHMAETARVLAEADSYLQKKGRELLAGCRKENGYLLDEKFFAQDPILQEYAVMEAFEILSGKRKDFTSLHVDQVLSLQKKENGRYINLPESLRVIRQYGGVCLKKIEEKKYTKWFDYDKIKNSPCVRTRRQGDYLTVNSEGGRKKLNRIFIDEKIPAEMRDRLPVVAAGSEILWIPGGRMNEKYKITSTTGRVLELHYQGGALA